MHHLHLAATVRRWASADRRGFFRQLAVGALALHVTRAEPNSVVARHRKRKRKRCRGGKKRCGKTCVRGACCPGRACGSAEPNCRCARSVEGRPFCQTGGVIVVDPCASSAECSPGFACIPDDDSDLSFCVPGCGVEP